MELESKKRVEEKTDHLCGCNNMTYSDGLCISVDTLALRGPPWLGLLTLVLKGASNCGIDCEMLAI